MKLCYRKRLSLRSKLARNAPAITQPPAGRVGAVRIDVQSHASWMRAIKRMGSLSRFAEDHTAAHRRCRKARHHCQPPDDEMGLLALTRRHPDREHRDNALRSRSRFCGRSTATLPFDDVVSFRRAAKILRAWVLCRSAATRLVWRRRRCYVAAGQAIIAARGLTTQRAQRGSERKRRATGCDMARRVIATFAVNTHLLALLGAAESDHEHLILDPVLERLATCQRESCWDVLTVAHRGERWSARAVVADTALRKH